MSLKTSLRFGGGPPPALVVGALTLVVSTLWVTAPARGETGGSAATEITEPDTLHVPIGTTSRPPGGAVRLQLVARFQNYEKEPLHPLDRRDKWIQSPKSVRFNGDGSRVYVNSLEGFMTQIYDPRRLSKLGDIDHIFDGEDTDLFPGDGAPFDYRFYEYPESGDVNRFRGKPVESLFTHGGRYLWISYYRRDFDTWGRSPSAMAVVDTAADSIVRVIPTGPIPKIITVSPDGDLLAVTHWGDNTIALLDISSPDPAEFTYLPDRLVVEEILRQDDLVEQSRDGACGYCLRGTVFTPDGETLLVGRMGGGGIAGFDVTSGRYLGTVTGMPPTPRHLLLSPDGGRLYLSSNRSGAVSSIDLPLLLSTLSRADGGKVKLSGWLKTRVGKGARTIALTPDGKLLLVTVFGSRELVALDAATLKVRARIAVDCFPVGLAISPDGKRVWTTSQGRNLQGGNSICIYDLIH